MKLIKVPTAPDQYIPAAHVVVCCLNCARGMKAREGYADLHGKPFSAYYCEDCARQLQRGAVK